MKSSAVLAVVIAGSGRHNRVWLACEIVTRRVKSAGNNVPQGKSAHQNIMTKEVMEGDQREWFYWYSFNYLLASR